MNRPGTPPADRPGPATAHPFRPPNHTGDRTTMTLDQTSSRRAWYALALGLGLAVAAMGYIGSFNNLATYGQQHGFPLNGTILPIGLDLGIPALLILDWLRASVFLRTAAWALAASTVTANAAVAGGGARDKLIHAALPAIAILIVEAGRHLKDDPTRMDKIRLSRWLLSPVRTVRLWRRMVLWEVTSYREALTRETAILQARTVLASAYGHRSWLRTRRQVPIALLHQLSTGQLPASVLYGPDLQAAVSEWVLNSLGQPAVEEPPEPVEPNTFVPVFEPVSVVVEVDPWDRVWDQLDRLVLDGLSGDQIATAYALARRNFEQVGQHIAGSRLTGPLRTGKEKALAVALALKTGYETGGDRWSEPRSETAPEPEQPAVIETAPAPAETAPFNGGPVPAIPAP